MPAIGLMPLPALLLLSRWKCSEIRNVGLWHISC